MNLMNGYPMYCKPAEKNVSKVLSGFDYEDFRQTMIKAKKAGLIIDGPEMKMAKVTRSFKKRVEIRKCEVCDKEYECSKNSMSKCCSPDCTKQLQIKAAKNRKSPTTKKIKLCQVCNKKEVSSRKAKTCSDACRTQLNPPKLPLCPVCGIRRLKSFHRKTCSAECSATIANEKK